MTSAPATEARAAGPPSPPPTGVRVARGFAWFAAGSGLLRAGLLAVDLLTDEGGRLASGVLVLGALVDVAAIFAIPFPIVVCLLLDLRRHAGEWTRAWLAFEASFLAQLLLLVVFW